MSELWQGHGNMTQASLGFSGQLTGFGGESNGSKLVAETQALC